MFDLDQLRRIHVNGLFQQRAAIDGAVTQILREAQRLAQGQNTIRDRTGKLRSGWLWKIKPTRDGATGTLYNAVPYALYQEKGTGLYGPRGAKYPIPRVPGRKKLRFYLNGNLTFRRSVMHPGVKPRWIGRASMFGHAAPYLGMDMLNSTRIFGRWMDQVARRF